jgi:hypothetical protein
MLDPVFSLNVIRNELRDATRQLKGRSAFVDAYLALAAAIEELEHDQAE